MFLPLQHVVDCCVSLVDCLSLLVDCCLCVSAAATAAVVVAIVNIVLSSAAASTCKDTRTIINLGWCCPTSAFLCALLVAGQQRLAQLQRRINRLHHAPHCCLQQSSNVVAKHVVATLGSNDTVGGIVAKHGVDATHGVIAKRVVVAKRGIVVVKCGIVTKRSIVPERCGVVAKCHCPSVLSPKRGVVVAKRSSVASLPSNNERPGALSMAGKALPPADYCWGRLVLKSGLAKEPRAP